MDDEIHAFIHACVHGDVEAVKNFLASGEGHPEYEFYKALDEASYHGHIEIVRLLLADPRMDPAEKHSALYSAAIMGHIKIMRMLLKWTGHADARVIEFAAKTKNIEMLKLLLEYVNEYKIYRMQTHSNMFTNACADGSIEVVKLLLDAGFDPSRNSDCAIQFASYRGHTEVVKLLLNDGRVNLSPYIVVDAVQSGCAEVVKLLLPRVTLDTKDIRSLFWYSVNFGYRGMSMILVLDSRMTISPVDVIDVSALGQADILGDLLDQYREYVCLRYYLDCTKHRTCADVWKKHLVKCYWVAREICREYLTVDLLELLM